MIKGRASKGGLSRRWVIRKATPLLPSLAVPVVFHSGMGKRLGLCMLTVLLSPQIGVSMGPQTAGPQLLRHLPD